MHFTVYTHINCRCDEQQRCNRELKFDFVLSFRNSSLLESDTEFAANSFLLFSIQSLQSTWFIFSFDILCSSFMCVFRIIWLLNIFLHRMQDNLGRVLSSVKACSWDERVFSFAEIVVFVGPFPSSDLVRSLESSLAWLNSLKGYCFPWTSWRWRSR